MEEKILEIMADVNEDILTYTGPNLVDDEIIDSFERISMVSMLEDAFDIEIDAEYVDEKHFGNKDRIIALMKELVKE